MDRQVRRKLAMATSVRSFSRAHPSTDASYTVVLDRLNGTISRIEQLAKQQEGGYASKHAATARRADLRRRLQAGLLRHLVTVAEDVGSEVPAVGEKFRIPKANANHAAFRASASEMLDQARVNQEVLVKHGMSATLLDDLDAAIKEFDASLEETHGGRQSHVAARAEMKTLCDEIMRLVGMLDGFNRYRFHRDPELIVAWKSAKHIVTGPEPKDDEATVPPSSPGVEKPAA
jgi:hypothetical protein